jgi:molecular chaperone GrpE
LTPQRIEAVLADFRTWLEGLAAAPPEPPPEPDEPAVDLATLAGALTALRHEVNLQTKAARAQAEQSAAALVQLGEAVELLKRPPADPDAAIRPLLTALVEAADALARAGDGVRRAAAPPRRRWFGAWSDPAALDATVQGLAMALQRLERALAQHGLEPVAAEGRPFDPETMEAVEAVADSGRPAGTVVAELRRGWRWRGRVFRCAQVAVAK